MLTQRLTESVQRLARLAQGDEGVPAVQRALAEELVALLGADEAQVLDLAEIASEPRHDAPAWVAATGRPLLVPDATVDGALPAGFAPAHGLAAAAVLPLSAAGTVRAVVVVGTRKPHAWREEALCAAGALADVAGAAIALRDARLAAAVDQLTGCLNHGAMLERLAEEIARARRQGTPLTVMILDLDDFKRVNDTYGHPTGDALLRHVGEALRHEYRSFDQVARYGGDEFVVILPNLRGARADAAAARALRLLRGIHIARDDGGHEGITVSVGIAEWVEPENAGDLLERADTALRETKTGGKDGLARAASPAPPPAALRPVPRA